MKILSTFSALLAVAVARTNVMLPLYVPPNSQEWQAAVDAIKKHPTDLDFFVVINPNSGPKSTSDPEGANRGSCNTIKPPETHPYCKDALVHGCNLDWSTKVAELNGLPNVHTIGYVYSRYGHEKDEEWLPKNPRQWRTRKEIMDDIDEWAAWDTACTWSSSSANIKINGIWFDETGVDKGNITEFTEMVTYARQAFKRPITIVLNPGSNLNNSDLGDGRNYEEAMFGLADAVVLRETCYTNDPSTSIEPDGRQDCPGNYNAFDYNTLADGNGMPFHPNLRSKSVVLVHQFHGPPGPGDAGALRTQVSGLVSKWGPHSALFTTRSWHSTTIGPADIGSFSDILAEANKA